MVYGYYDDCMIMDWLIEFNKQIQQILSLMAFSRNSQRNSKASPHSINKKPQKPSTHASRAPPNEIISTIRQLPQNQKDWSQSMRHLLRELLQQENKSMQAMLNSSINHFTQYINDHEDIETQNHQLMRQNQRLTTAIDELRTILKQKLEGALKKQREDLNVMMQDYIQLIQKLLKDKEAFALKLEIEGNRAAQAEQLANALMEEQDKIMQFLQQKEKGIDTVNAELEAKNVKLKEICIKSEELIKQNQQLKFKIAQLEQYKRTSISHSHLSTDIQVIKQESNPSKSRFLLQLLEQSQEQIKKLRQRLRNEIQNSKKDELIQQLTTRIKQMQQEHEQQFKQYEQSMREVLERKDSQIEKLTKINNQHRKQQRNSPI